VKDQVNYGHAWLWKRLAWPCFARPALPWRLHRAILARQLQQGKPCSHKPRSNVKETKARQWKQAHPINLVSIRTDQKRTGKMGLEGKLKFSSFRFFNRHDAAMKL
jgi:hypothetical protein